MVKTRELQRWFAKHIKDGEKPYTLDKYQARIVGDAHRNTLVTARAGSGKTRTLVAKIIYLVAHEGLQPEEIIAFSFNKKAREEITERLKGITFDDTPIFKKKPEIASTFHAFSYKILGGKNGIGKHLISEEIDNQLASETAKQFITRAEQRFFRDYGELKKLIMQNTRKTELQILYNVFAKYQEELRDRGLVNFNQMVARAANELKGKNTPYKYILVDEYQDFSLLFLNLILALRRTCPEAKLLAVGDDWQAINRFAGSDVEYFLHFSKYFPEDNARLFIPTNYRSGKMIVKNANYFMSRALKDYKGCKSGGKKKARIYVRDIQKNKTHQTDDLPLLLENYLHTALEIIQKNRDKSIMILHRNNDLSFRGYNLDSFETMLKNLVIKNQLMSKADAERLISTSTIHKSKGLEADIVILLEIDAEKFPGKDKTDGLYTIFGDTKKNQFYDEARLFYVALTRPREKLYILSKTTKVIRDKKNPSKQKLNFFNYLNDNWLNEF